MAAPKNLFPCGTAFQRQLGGYEDLRTIAEFWRLEPMQLVAGEYQAHLHAIYTDHAELSLVRHGCGTHVRGRIPAGTVVLSLPDRTSAHMQFQGQRLGQGHLIVQDERDGIDFSFHQPVSIFSLALQRETLERRSSLLWQCDASGHFSGLMQFESAAYAEHARRTLERLLRETFETPAPQRSTAWGRRTETAIIDGFLAGVNEPLPPEGATARRWIARRAAALLEECCHEEIDIGWLCEKTGASRRTLHLGFLELYGLPPMKYLRALRLHGVRRDLKKKSPNPNRVTEVATRWGFTHLGRFAAAYREFFGELPSAKNL